MLTVVDDHTQKLTNGLHTKFGVNDWFARKTQDAQIAVFERRNNDFHLIGIFPSNVDAQTLSVVFGIYCSAYVSGIAIGRKTEGFVRDNPEMFLAKTEASEGSNHASAI